MTPAERMPPQTGTEEEVDRVVAGGPGGAFALAGIAAAIVVALYFLFYFFVYLPRGAVQ